MKNQLLGLPTNNIVLLSARVMMAASMIVYGSRKLLDISMFTSNFATQRLMELVFHGGPCPLWFAYANALFQTLAGVMVLLGLQTRHAAMALTLWLIALTYLGHPFWSMLGVEQAFNESMFYRNLGLIAAFAMIFTTGGGKFSVDQLLSDARSQTPVDPA